MLKIRLSRVGKKHQPSFRIILQEHTSAVKGKFIEELGYYSPVAKDKPFSFNAERAAYWLSKGAQPSDSMAVLLKKHNVSGMEKFIGPRNHKHKSKKVVEEKPVQAAPAAPAAAPATEVAPAKVQEAAPAAEAPQA